MSNETLAVRVEQARALHPTWTAERAATEVGVSVQFVADTWALQDAATGQEDRELPEDDPRRGAHKPADTDVHMCECGGTWQINGPMHICSEIPTDHAQRCAQRRSEIDAASPTMDALADAARAEMAKLYGRRVRGVA